MSRVQSSAGPPGRRSNVVALSKSKIHRFWGNGQKFIDSVHSKKIYKILIKNHVAAGHWFHTGVSELHTYSVGCGFTSRLGRIYF